LASSNIFGQ